MALFGLKEVLDPMAKEVREGYQEIRERLDSLAIGLEGLRQEQRTANYLAQETNRLLRGLVKLGAGGPGSMKASIVENTLNPAAEVTIGGKVAADNTRTEQNGRI